ncbi:MAG: hypothetical protein ACLQVG_33670 [Terriglobia bacterium]
MRISVRGITLAGAILWACAILLVGLINVASPGYGVGFLQMTSSVYPGFHVNHTIGSVLMGTLEGFIDGAVAGLLFALLYNSIAVRAHHAQASPKM